MLKKSTRKKHWNSWQHVMCTHYVTLFSCIQSGNAISLNEFKRYILKRITT